MLYDYNHPKVIKIKYSINNDCRQVSSIISPNENDGDTEKKLLQNNEIVLENFSNSDEFDRLDGIIKKIRKKKFTKLIIKNDDKHIPEAMINGD